MFEAGKEYKTRGGLRARVRAIDAAGWAVQKMPGHGRGFALTCAETAILTCLADAK